MTWRKKKNKCSVKKVGWALLMVPRTLGELQIGRRFFWGFNPATTTKRLQHQCLGWTGHKILAPQLFSAAQELVQTFDTAHCRSKHWQWNRNHQDNRWTPVPQKGSLQNKINRWLMTWFWMASSHNGQSLEPSFSFRHHRKLHQDLLSLLQRCYTDGSGMFKRSGVTASWPMRRKRRQGGVAQRQTRLPPPLFFWGSKISSLLLVLQEKKDTRI